MGITLDDYAKKLGLMLNTDNKEKDEAKESKGLWEQLSSTTTQVFNYNIPPPSKMDFSEPLPKQKEAPNNHKQLYSESIVGSPTPIKSDDGFTCMLPAGHYSSILKNDSGIVYGVLQDGGFIIAQRDNPVKEAAPINGCVISEVDVAASYYSGREVETKKEDDEDKCTVKIEDLAQELTDVKVNESSRFISIDERSEIYDFYYDLIYKHNIYKREKEKTEKVIV